MNAELPAPMFSIVVPVYNVEEYLEECLDSLLAQTETDWELLAVDDGSTDACAGILLQYAAREPRMRVISQKNGGLSVARNTGLDAARGRFSLFVDSDDVVHPQLLEVCRHFLQKYDADFISYNYSHIEPHEGMLPAAVDVATLPAHFTCEPLKLIGQRHRHRIPLMAWLSCYRTELARRHRFMPGLLYEDYPHTVALLRDVERAVTLQHPLYGYTRRPGSIMNSGRLTSENVAHYRRGLLSVVEAYAQEEAKFSIVRRLLFPEILKQLGNIIFRDDRDRPSWLPMLAAFRRLLLEFDGLGLLQMRGHKLRRYLAYRKLINCDEQKLAQIVGSLSRVFR